MATSRYAGIEKVQEDDGRNPRLPVGKYIVDVVGVVDGDKNEVEFYVADLKVAHVFFTSDADTVAGCTRSYFVKLNVPKMRDKALSRIKSFVRCSMSSVLGETVRQDDIQAQHIDESAGEDQPLTGARLLVEVVAKPREGKAPWIDYNFSVPTPEELAAAGL